LASIAAGGGVGVARHCAGERERERGNARGVCGGACCVVKKLKAGDFCCHGVARPRRNS
jgi:hypothetical protein